MSEPQKHAECKKADIGVYIVWFHLRETLRNQFNLYCQKADPSSPGAKDRGKLTIKGQKGNLLYLNYGGDYMGI